MGRGKGYVRDGHNTALDLPSHRRFGATRQIPAPGSYGGLEPLVGALGGVLEQGETETCVGFALSTGIDLHALAIGAMRPGDPRRSPVAPWAFAQVLQRGGKGPAEQPLLNVGVQPTLAATGMLKFGVPSVEQWPFDPANITREPTLAQLEGATAFRVEGWTRVQSDGPQRLADVRLALSHGCPVAVGCDIDEAFEAYDGEGALGPSDASKIVGGHMPLLVGYDSAGRFRGLNSWGTTWGDRGFFWAMGEWLMSPAIGDVIVVTGELVER